MSRQQTGERVHYIQWLRVFLILLVVAHHAGQPYGPTGGAWPVDDPANSDVLLFFFAINAAFFMGFFFLLSGYFIERSYDRRGAAPFLWSRLIRLGIPLVVFVILVNGSSEWANSESARGYFDYLINDYVKGWRFEFAHLWFIAHLLIYAALFVMWRRFTSAPDPNHLPEPPRHLRILIFTVALASVSFLVRQVYPQDTWVRLFWTVPAEMAHLPQYASLFVVGVIAGRGRWFENINRHVAYTWFWIGVLAFLINGMFEIPGINLPGGYTARDLWDFVDSFICVGMILGLLALFQRHFDKTGPWAQRLAGGVFGVYLLHMYVVIGLQFAILEFEISALSKFALVTVAGSIISFSIVDLFRRIRWLRLIL
jgi:peptidoglycan/LPS O-acetylase OafA/YrhL